MRCSWRTTRPTTSPFSAERATRPTCHGPRPAWSTPLASPDAPLRAMRCATASSRPSRASFARPLPRAIVLSTTRAPPSPCSTGSWSGWARSACTASRTCSPSAAAPRLSSAPSATLLATCPRPRASMSFAMRRATRSTSAPHATFARACAPTSRHPSSASACPRWWASLIASIPSSVRPILRHACANCA